MNSGDLARLSILIALAAGLGVMAWLIWLLLKRIEGQGKHIAAISAQLDAEQKRQEALARSIILPSQRTGDDDDDGKRHRHLHIAPVIAITSAAGWAARQAVEHPARTGMALAAMTAALITPAHGPKPHFNGGPQPLPNITAPVIPTETPSPSELPHRRRRNRPANIPIVPPSSEGPGQSTAAGPTDAPVSSAPPSSAPVRPEPTPILTPTATVPVPSSTESVSPPETPPPTATPTVTPTHPPTSAPPSTPPSHPGKRCVVKLELLGAVRVCVGSAEMQGPTAP